MTVQNIADYSWTTANAPHTMRYLLPVIEQMCPQLPEGSRVLDIGCGNGFLAGWFEHHGNQVTGIDHSEIRVNMARTLHPNSRFEQLAVSEDLLDRLDEPPFDLVVSTEVVEHLYDPYEWARACFAALKPGGSLLCSTPYHGYLKNLCISITNGWDRHLNPHWVGGHIKLWSKPMITTLLTESGFVNLKIRGAGRLPLLWKSMVVLAQKPAG